MTLLGKNYVATDNNQTLLLYILIYCLDKVGTVKLKGYKFFDSFRVSETSRLWNGCSFIMQIQISFYVKQSWSVKIYFQSCFLTLANITFINIYVNIFCLRHLQLTAYWLHILTEHSNFAKENEAKCIFYNIAITWSDYKEVFERWPLS